MTSGQESEGRGRTEDVKRAAVRFLGSREQWFDCDTDAHRWRENVVEATGKEKERIKGGLCGRKRHAIKREHSAV